MPGFATEISIPTGTVFLRLIIATGSCTLDNQTPIHGWVWFGEYVTTKELRGGYFRPPGQLVECDDKVFGTVQEFKPVTKVGQTFKLLIGDVPYNCRVSAMDQNLSIASINSAAIRSLKEQANKPDNNYNNLQYWMNERAIELGN